MRFKSVSNYEVEWRRGKMNVLSHHFILSFSDCASGTRTHFLSTLPTTPSFHHSFLSSLRYSFSIIATYSHTFPLPLSSSLSLFLFSFIHPFVSSFFATTLHPQPFPDSQPLSTISCHSRIHILSQ